MKLDASKDSNSGRTGKDGKSLLRMSGPKLSSPGSMKPGKSFEMKLPSGESKCSDRKLGLYIFFIALLEKCTWLWAGVGLIEI